MIVNKKIFLFRSLLIYVLVIFLFTLFSSFNLTEENLTIDIKTPLIITPGESFISELHIKIPKGKKIKTLWIKQYFPENFNIKMLETSGADYKWDKDELRFLYIGNLIEGNDYIIKYKVRPDFNTTGYQYIKGEYKYISDNVYEMRLPIQKLKITNKSAY